MMKTFLPNTLGISKPNFIFALLLVLVFTSASAQNFRGKDGAETYSLGTSILNRYTSLAASQAAGSLTITVTDITQLSGSAAGLYFANPYATDALSKGDLVMIVQVQGADITTTDDVNYGDITAYNNTGNYEVKTVFAVSGNTISLCQNLSNSYTQGARARTQVIRVPRLTTLTIGGLASVTGMAWNGVAGGVVAIETSGDITVNGSINASEIGFRGGVDDKTTSITSGSPAVTLYRTTVTTTTAGKGEGIAGNVNDYHTYLNGGNGRGAAANAGGGGNGHNAGGGGGSNAGTNGVLAPWNGTGVKNNTTAAWTTAWNLEAANFASDVSTGAGRGGYSYSNSNQDAIAVGPTNAAWGGDKRNVVGGLGGRPLNYNGNTRVFMGGGGGAGDGNNSSAGNGGNGGGIVYFLSTGNITGSGSITANGQVGYNTILTNIDGAGGGGGGGAIIADIKGTITGVSLQANGGNGGNQLFLLAEAEGPGGGGGGGYIATPATGVVKSVTGGDNGSSSSAQVTEFLPNGATQGSGGTVVNRSFLDVYYCDAIGTVLPIKLQSFTASLQNSTAKLNWTAETDTKSSYFELERSTDGQNFTKIATINTTGSEKVSYAYNDELNGATKNTFYYRLKMVDPNQKFTYSETRLVRTGKTVMTNISAYPNPVINDLRITLSTEWQGKNIRFEIYDMSGKLARSENSRIASQTESVSLKGLGAGIYVLRAITDNEISQQRIVKN